MAFGYPHSGMMQPRGLAAPADFGADDPFMGSAGFNPLMPAGHPSPMIAQGGRPRLLTSPSHGGSGGLSLDPLALQMQQPQHHPAQLQDLYSPGTPLSPLDVQQARAMQIQQIQAARAAQQQQHQQYPHARSQTMSVHPAFQKRRGSMSMPQSPMMGGMPAFDPKEDDYAGFDAQQMQYLPQMDDETAYIRSGYPSQQLQPSQMHMLAGTGFGQQQHSTNDDFEVEQEVNIKTKLKGRGSMSGRAGGQGQFGMQGGMGFMPHGQFQQRLPSGMHAPMGQYGGIADPRMRRAPTPF